MTDPRQNIANNVGNQTSFEVTSVDEAVSFAHDTLKPVDGVFLHGFDDIDERLLERVGGKSANLVRLRQSGLPVPPGFCITTDAHEYYLEHGALPLGLVDEVAEAKSVLGGRVAIRSSANCEDGADLSMAGVFESYYVYDDTEIKDAIEGIFEQARSKEVLEFMDLHDQSSSEVKMGIVLQELIEPVAAGVLYTDVNENDLLIQYVDGFGARLVDGETAGSTLLATQTGTVLESVGFESRPLPITVIRILAQYAQIIKGVFPGVAQDIEFAYDGQSVHVLQARTLTTDLGHVELAQETIEDLLEATKHKLRLLVEEEKRDLGTETVVFSDSNYSELLPRPTEMDIGLHMYVWGGSDGIPGAKQLGHSAMGYLVGDEATGVIKYIGGRTYFSIGRSAGLYHIGFPKTKDEYYSTLVKEYLMAVNEDPSKGEYPQMGLYLQDPTLEDLQTRYGDRAKEYYEIYQNFTAGMATIAEEFLSGFYDQRLPEMTTFVANMQEIDLSTMTNEQLVGHANLILEHIRTVSYLNFVQAARLGFYYSQRLQDVLQAQLGIEHNMVQELYSRLNQGLDGSAITDANIAIAEASSDTEAMVIAEKLIGHYSTGEMLEIRHPVLRDAKGELYAYVRGIRQSGNYKALFDKQRIARLQAQQDLLNSISEDQKLVLESIVWSSQTYMALRETAKYHLTRENLLLKDTLEMLEQRLGLAKGDVYFIYPREIALLVEDPISMRHIIRARRHSFNIVQELDLPSVIRESDIEGLGLQSKDVIDFTELTGKFLAEGEAVEGRIVNIDEFENLDDVRAMTEQYQQQNIPVILVGKQMNLSHDPLIAQAAGLVIENAGIVAHGAQRARELGKGAIGGVQSRKLKSGVAVFFDPANRLIKKIA